MSAASSRSSAIRALRSQLRATQSAGLARQYLSSGMAEVDRLLPEGGLPTGAVVEWIAEHSGQSAASIALTLASGLLTLPGCVAVIDGRAEFHAAALSAVGIPLSRLLLIRPGAESDRTATAARSPQATATAAATTLRSLPTQQADTLWALEQAARCPGVRLVVCWLGRVSSTALRRLQLAVERSGTTVFLIRPASVRKEPSWSDLRFTLSANDDATVRLRVARARHATQQSAVVQLRVDHETGVVRSVSELAGSAADDESAAGDPDRRRAAHSPHAAR